MESIKKEIESGKASEELGISDILDEIAEVSRSSLEPMCVFTEQTQREGILTFSRRQTYIFSFRTPTGLKYYDLTKGPGICGWEPRNLGEFEVVKFLELVSDARDHYDFIWLYHNFRSENSPEDFRTNKSHLQYIQTETALQQALQQAFEYRSLKKALEENEEKKREMRRKK